MKQRIILLFICFTWSNINAQQKYYIEAFSEIVSILSDGTKKFKEAVFLTEKAYYNGEFDKGHFDSNINLYSAISKNLAITGNIQYAEKDKDNALIQCGTFFFMTDTVHISVGNDIVESIPFSYNYEDFAGQKDWSNMFVSTLMETNKGNCHSLPYLYKIIMDELGYKCHLALAPNHIYIKANNKKVGWYNIELTCGDFPTDAWYAASGYIHTDAIRNGIYMKALTDKEAVAMTLVDLAQGYQVKFGIEDGSFILKCCDTALEHFPKYINAMLLKAEILTELYREAESEQKDKLFAQMTELYTNIHKLGYRKMPQQMYANWLNSLNVEDRNQGIKAIMNPSTKMK